MDQKWIRILAILVFYPSKFSFNFRFKKISLKGSCVFFRGGIWKQREEQPANAFLLSHLLEMASTSGDIVVNNGATVEITCKCQLAPTTMWFRVLDKAGMEFIASFDKDGKPRRGLPGKFNADKMNKNILTLTSFNKAEDSGVYSCAIVQSSGLQFGQTTRLRGGEFGFKSLISSWHDMKDTFHQLLYFSS